MRWSKPLGTDFLKILAKFWKKMDASWHGSWSSLRKTDISKKLEINWKPFLCGVNLRCLLKWIKNQCKNDTQKVSKIVSKVVTKSIKIEVWTGPRGSWGRPWESFWVPRPPGTAKRGQAAKMCTFLGPHLETNFWIFFGFVYTFLHFVFEFPFWSLPEPIFDGFWSQNGSQNGPKFIQIQIFWKS